MNQFRSAPTFTSNQWPDFADRTWAESLHRHYGREPYWQREGSTGAGGRNVPSRETWYSYPTSWNRLSELRGISVKNTQGKDLGQLNDVTIDPSTGRILYGVVTVNNRMHAVPWSALTVDTKARVASIDATEEQFQESYAFSQDKWPNMADPTWTTETYRRFRVDPYWTDDDENSSKRKP